MIYCLGNSHAHFFTDSHPGELGWGKKQNEYFRSYSGNFHNPQYRHVLAHKFKERFFPYFISPINSIDWKDGDYLMFIVGEIDCRWHFPKKIYTQDKEVNDVIAEEMEYFFPVILELKKNGYPVIGWGGHASTNKGHNDDPDNPIYGEPLFRNEVSLAWSDLLEKRCKENEIPFVSILRDLILPSGLTKMEYFYDDYHLNPHALPFAIKKLQQIGIINVSTTSQIN